MSDGWKEYAACATVDPELFYPEPGRSDIAREAKQVCMSCPVRPQCAARGLGDDGMEPERSGIWGGLTESERQLILRRRSQSVAA